MKKTSLILIVITFIGISFILSCESDDICSEATATTPSLIIDLYDVNTPENIKGLTKVIIGGVGNDFLFTNGSIALQQIIIPLKTDADATQYSLWKDPVVNDNNTPDDASDDFYDGGNVDVITIQYTREDIYVSRACGYKTIYKNVTLYIEPDTDNWIKSRQPLTENQSVEDETETHFNIYH